MKKIYSIISFFIFTLMISCQSEDITNGLTSDMGYLRLNVNTSSSTTTKGEDGLPEGYDPKQLFVAILDAKGDTVQSTDDFKENWENGKSFQLKVGTYTITANSNGFDGSTARHGENPYYAGDTTVVITAGKEIAADLVCRLADVKITVQYESSFVKAFSAANVKIRPEVSTVTALNFPLNGDVTVGYLPVSDFTAGIQVTNMAGVTNSKDTLISGVQARDHYIFIYRVDLEGDGKIEVEADDSQRVYTYIFPVTTTPSTSVKVESANAWSNFAYLSGAVTPKDPAAVVPAGNVTFEYQLASADEDSDPWTTLAAEADGTNTYKATLKNLTPGTSYRYRLVCEWEGETPISSAKSFTTETQCLFPYGSMENWYKDGKIPMLGVEDDDDFWDTSNPGSDIASIYPTYSVTSPIHGGTYAACLNTEGVDFDILNIHKLAAASLYSGAFNDLVGTSGAKLDWGRKFTARPTQVKGWYQYTTGKADYTGSHLSSSDYDLWSAYVVLVKKKTNVDSDFVLQVNNTDMDNFPQFASDFASGETNDNYDIIAYGGLSDDFCKQQVSSWTEFSIDLTYANLTEKPTHIIIVISSSKYGDYFEGSTSSLLYLDDLEFVYGEPTLK